MSNEKKTREQKGEDFEKAVIAIVWVCIILANIVMLCGINSSSTFIDFCSFFAVACDIYAVYVFAREKRYRKRADAYYEKVNAQNREVERLIKERSEKNSQQGGK